MSISSTTRPISGGGSVKIFSSSKDDKIYLAHVTMTGNRYPEKGHAVNKGQVEAVYVTAGELIFTLDGEKHVLGVGEVIYFDEGVKYTVEGTGEALVAITPAHGGETIIETD